MNNAAVVELIGIFSRQKEGCLVFSFFRQTCGLPLFKITFWEEGYCVYCTQPNVIPCPTGRHPWHARDKQAVVRKFNFCLCVGYFRVCTGQDTMRVSNSVAQICGVIYEVVAAFKTEVPPLAAFALETLQK